MQNLQGVVNPQLMYKTKGTWTTGGLYLHYIEIWVWADGLYFDVATHRGPKWDDYTDVRLRKMRAKYQVWLEEHEVIISGILKDYSA